MDDNKIFENESRESEQPMNAKPQNTDAPELKNTAETKPAPPTGYTVTGQGGYYSSREPQSPPRAANTANFSPRAATPPPVEPKSRAKKPKRE